MLILRNLAFLATTLAIALVAHAQSSTSTVTYQGVLTQNGSPVADGAYTLTFKIYDAATAGNVVETINVPGVQTTQGRFAALVPVTPSTFNGSDRWWSVTFSGTELPRQIVTATPYAMAARDLAPIVGGTDPRVTGTLRSTKGFLAEDGELNSFSFVGRFRQGYYPDWNGTGREADFYRLIGHGDMHTGFGVAVGQDIASPVLWMYNQTGNAFKVVSVPFGQMVRDGNELFSVSHTGETRCRVLTITGGSDVAEPVAVTPTLAVPKAEPGMVMVIDRDHDGRLVPCAAPYDNAVAGVLSGANGLKPGMVLSAEGQPCTAPGSDALPLAMAGRVWVWCDATTAAVFRGDSLTTSSTPGHAMKATDRDRAFGSVIGKAMTELKEGKGLVLVLVNLQ